MKPELVMKAALGEVSSITSENPNGEFHVVLSTGALDRHGEVFDANAFDPLPDHITFDIDHGLNVKSVVGSGVPYYADDAHTIVEVKGTFASTPQGQEMRALVTEGHIRNTSVAALATREKSRGVTHITKAQMLNGSFVIVGANPETSVLSAKSLLSHTEDEPVVTKAIVGSVEALQQRVRDALCAYAPRYCYLRGVIPDGQGGGVVVFDTPDDDWDLDSYQQAYTDDGTVVTLIGDPTAVDVVEVVVPDAEATRDAEDPLEKSAVPPVPQTTDDNDNEAAPAATDAAKAAPVTADAVEAVVIARARIDAQRRAFLGR